MLTLIATVLFATQAAPGDARSSSAARSIFHQTAPHWSLPCDQPAVRRQSVQFDITLDSGGRIVAGPTPVRPRLDDPDWRAAAERARVALIAAAPFDVPPGYPGGAYRPTFRAETACAASDEP
jgi:hypothetical protein